MITVTFLLKPSPFRKITGQALKRWSHQFSYAEGIRREASVAPGMRCHYSQPVSELCSSKIVSGCHGILNRRRASQGDHLVKRLLRGIPQTIQRHRLQRCNVRTGALLPRNMVENITCSSLRANESPAREADCPKTVHKDAWLFRFIIQREPAFDILFAALLNCGPDKA
jgi:hypothetical protein